ALKHKLALDSGRLGIVIFTVSAVATLSLPFAGWIASRRGSRSPACVGLVLASGALAAAAFAPSLAFLSLVAVGLGLKAELPAVGAALALLALASAPRLLGGTAADVATSHFALPRGVLAL